MVFSIAEKRMFAKTIIDSDAFLEMPTSTQCLYFHLSMRADDDGFINNPKKIQRFVGCSDDDLRILIMKRFIIPFESGIVVIKHWKLHNYIQNDRYKPTVYQEEKEMLVLKNNKTYTLKSELPMLNDCNQEEKQDCIQNVYKAETQIRLDKIRLEESNSSEQNCSKQDEPTFITLTLNDKSEYAISEKQVDEWKELYPAVNVEQELRNMKGWLNSNPKKRKTKSGIKRFVTSWLSRSQDKGGNINQGGQYQSKYKEL